jgi:nucleoside 2-deoxyribosyltransferase
LYGSAGRAAAALSYRHPVKLVTYVDEANKRELDALAETRGFELRAESVPETVSFDYVHPLSVPVIQPPPQVLSSAIPLTAQGDVVLRFGMMESTGAVEGGHVVYDPQSAYAPEPFAKNGSKAKSLAIVANALEVRLLTGNSDAEVGGSTLLASEGAAVVVVKRGSRGALVLTAGAKSSIPAFRTESVFSIGSGDMFAAAFTYFWAIESLDPALAAELASKATARYCASQAAELLTRAELEALPYDRLTTSKGKVYLAGPFFTLAERWLVEEARTHLRGMQLDVFSPIHDVGLGPAEKVAEADLKGVEECDRVLALVDSADPGTLFEVGYARKCGKPVVALTETLSEEKKKMLIGSGCICTEDFATAIYLTAWVA